MAEGRYLIGLDVGTTAVKGGLFDRSGGVVACQALTYPTDRPEPGRVEQNPEEWVAAIVAILVMLLKDVAVEDVAAIGLCSQVNTHVLVDRAGLPLMPAIVWQDSRAAAVAAELDARIPEDRKIDWWGAAFPIGATSVVSRMAWVARNRPDLWDRTAHVLSPKDYCLFRLTGILSADPISAFDAVDITGNYIPELLALVPGAADRLPPLRRFDEVLGPARFPPFKRAGPPLVTGTMDGWACLPGAGVAGPGDGAYISGTSEIIALVSDRRIGAAGIVSFLPVGGWHVHAGPTQSGGDSLRWFSQVCDRSPEQVLEQAALADRSRSRVLFLPHLEGERAPLWDPYSRGAFIGMGADTGFEDLAVAVLEGVGFSARLLFEAAAGAAGTAYDCLRMGGGGARSNLWCQIRADIMGIELRRGAFLDSGTLGAAIIAGVGIGLFPSLSVAAREMARPGRSFTPNEALRSRYDELFGLYQDAYRALTPVHRRLIALTGQ
jgi:xylulokinase